MGAFFHNSSSSGYVDEMKIVDKEVLNKLAEKYLLHTDELQKNIRIQSELVSAYRDEIEYFLNEVGVLR